MASPPASNPAQDSPPLPPSRADQVAASPLWFAAGLVLLCLYLWSHSRAPIYLDDSMITLHCVTNALEGKGLVFNEGEYKQVYSNPGYTLTLLAMGVAGISPLTAAYLVFHISTILLILFLGLAFAKSGAREAALLVAFFFFHEQHLWHSAKGMETSLLMCLAAAALALWLHGRYVWCGAVAAWATLCRPDAIVIGALMALGIAFKWRNADKEERRRMIMGAGVYVLIGAAWAIFALIYYGDYLPQSVRAKSLHNKSYGYKLLADVLRPRYLDQYGSWKLLLPLAVIPLFFRRAWWVAVGAAWGLLNLALLLAGDAPYYHWYVIPAAVSLVALGVLGGFLLVQRIMPMRARVWLGPAVVVAAGIYAITLIRPAAFEGTFRPQAGDRSQAGEYIASQAAPGDRIMAHDIGFLGFFSGCHVIDSVGLASQEVHPFLRASDNYAMVLRYRPEWIVEANTVEDPYTLLTNYSQVYQSKYDPVFRRRAWKPAAVWADSPELRAAIDQGRQTILLDWPEIARDPAEFTAFISDVASSAPAPLFLYSSAIEEAIERPEAEIFAPRLTKDSFEPRPDIRRVLNAVAEKLAGRDSPPSGARMTIWDFERVADWNSVTRLGLAVVNADNIAGRAFRPEHGDPHIRRDDLNLDYHARFVMIEYSIAADIPAWRASDVFFTVKPGENFTGEITTRRRLNHDGQTHWVLFDLDAVKPYAKTDTIHRFRWDPIGNYLDANLQPRKIVFIE